MLWLIIKMLSVFLHAEDSNQFLRVPIRVPSADMSIWNSQDAEKLFADWKDKTSSDKAFGFCRSPAGFDYSNSEIGVQSCQSDYNRIYLPSGFQPKAFCESGDCSFDNPVHWVETFVD